QAPELCPLLAFQLSRARGRIIGGKEVEAHSRPYMAYLKIQVSNKTDTTTYSCGGFLIRPDAVLSAAHLNITVILGAHNINFQERSQQRVRVVRWVIHPKYCPAGYKNDIVLLKLKKKAKINKNVQLISLPRHNERVTEGTECEVAGWGWTSRTGHPSDVMMEVEQEVQSEEPCQLLFDNYQACLTPLTPLMTQGDSGGPLVCNKKAHGIVSHGLESRLFPKVFTRVSYFEPWIRQQLRRFALQELPASPSSQ
uniref:Peptidase S1 domain-containing protein n=1 Tax=Catharus ustulatus TaxID=91951 RepID=A0A8C3UXB2_CATUS